MRLRLLVLAVAVSSSIASGRGGGVTIGRPGVPWDSGETFAAELTLREGQTRTLRATLTTEGTVESALFVDLEMAQVRGEGVLSGTLGWPEHPEDEQEAPLAAGDFLTLHIEDALRGCNAVDTGWNPPAEEVGGSCITTVDLVLTLQGEGNVLVRANPTLSAPWADEGAAWISGFDEVE